MAHVRVERAALRDSVLGVCVSVDLTSEYTRTIREMLSLGTLSFFGTNSASSRSIPCRDHSGQPVGAIVRAGIWSDYLRSLKRISR
jgi:hypothetical protein